MMPVLSMWKCSKQVVSKVPLPASVTGETAVKIGTHHPPRPLNDSEEWSHVWAMLSNEGAKFNSHLDAT